MPQVIRHSSRGPRPESATRRRKTGIFRLKPACWKVSDRKEFPDIGRPDHRLRAVSSTRLRPEHHTEQVVRETQAVDGGSQMVSRIAHTLKAFGFFT